MKPKNQPATSQSDVSTQTDQSTADVAVASLTQATDVLAVDAHAGKGGSFIFNPETGERTKAA